jgi:antitoxin VapB
MALSLKHPEADRLARELARETGEGLTQAVIVALRERLDRTRRNRGAGLASEILRIGKECAGLPVLDERSPDEILSYEPDGLPH